MALPKFIPSVYGDGHTEVTEHQLTGISQRLRSVNASRWEDIVHMAMAAIPDSLPEARVLVVDDESNIVELLSVSLKFQGFEVHTASSGPAALDKAREVRPDAVILDVMMPGMDGFGVLRRLRADGIDSPALFLTARDSLQDKIAGLTLGGDDYVTKPFSLEEVVARLRVILRRSGRGVEEPRSARLTFADIELDEDTHEVWKAGEPVSLSPTEFTLLRYFIINAGTVLSKPKILDHVWRYDFGGDVNVVESYVSYLRRKIDTGEKRLLHTLRGVGYVLREPR
jgi:two-component system OmpR family response regulator